MTSMAAKYISKKILGETVKNNFGSEDPYFEQVPATRLDGKPSNKTKKVRKALPAGLTEHDGKVLTKVKRRAYRLDISLFNCCGIRFGWSSVIGIIPVIGDFIDLFMALMVLKTCQQVEGGLPASVNSKMMFNIILDFAVGLVPFLGDVADAVFRANTRNAVELEKYLRQKGVAALKAQGHAAPVLDPSDPDEYDRHMREQHGPPPAYAEETRGTARGGAAPPATATRAQADGTADAAPAKEQKKGRWISGVGSQKKKQTDLEMGGVARREDAALPPAPEDQPKRTRSTLRKDRPGV